MSLTLVNTTYTNTGASSTPSVTLSSPASAGHWLLIFMASNFQSNWTIATDNSDIFLPVGITTGSGGIGRWWLCQLTQSASAIVFTNTHVPTSSNLCYYVASFEISGSNLQLVNNTGIWSGGTGHAFERSTFGASVVLPAMAPISASGNSLYLIGFTAAAFGVSQTISVDAGWTKDTAGNGTVEATASAYNLTTGSQTPTWSWTPSALQGDGSGVIVQETGPTVLSITPASGTTFGGTPVTVSGSNFEDGATITFDGTAATDVVFGDSTTLTCLTPAHAAGAVTVTVTNPDTTSGSLAAGYTYIAPVDVTDTDLLKLMQYMLMENKGDQNADGTTLITSMFTISQLVDALDQKQQRFLKDTGCVVTQAQQVASAGVAAYALPGTSIAVRRVSWQELDGTIKALTRSDTWELDNGDAAWPTASGTPIAWWETTLASLRIGIARAPSTPGQLNLLIIELAQLLTGLGIHLTVPDDFTPYVLWGALADIFNAQGTGYDPVRAQWCMNRYDEGVELCRLVLRGPE